MARRRSGNMGSPPSGQSPFSSAENMLKLRREGRRFVDEAAAAAGALGGGYKGHDEKLAGAIAAAWWGGVGWRGLNSFDPCFCNVERRMVSMFFKG